MRGRLEIVIVALLAVGLAGCGVKGPLEPPPGEPNAASAPDQSTSPEGSEKTRKPHRPFILDGLL